MDIKKTLKAKLNMGYSITIMQMVHYNPPAAATMANARVFGYGIMIMV